MAGFKPDSGKARIAYACQGTGNGAEIHWLYYSSSSAKWVDEVVGHAPTDTIQNLDLAFDPASSQPSILASYQFGMIRFSYDGATWVQDTVTDGANDPSASLAFDPVTGEPAVAWSDSPSQFEELHYSVYDSATKTWSEPTHLNEMNVLGVPSLAFDPTGVPWIAFDHQVAEFYDGLVVDHLDTDGVTWISEGVDRGGYTGVAPSAAFAGAKLRVAYYDQSNGNLRWAARGSGWTLKTLDSTNDVGDRPSLAFDASASAYISYFGHTTWTSAGPGPAETKSCLNWRRGQREYPLDPPPASARITSERAAEGHRGRGLGCPIPEM